MGMGKRAALLAVIAAASIAAAPAQDAASAGDARHIFTVSGQYAGIEADDGGWQFALVWRDQRFRLPRASEAESEAFLQLLDAASERGFSVRVRYDGTVGRADAEGGYVVYPLCSLSVGDVEPLGDEAANCPAHPVEPPVAGEAKLALGLAMAVERTAEARAMLGEALADARLPNPLRAIAFHVRGEASEALASIEPYAGEAYDRLHAEALQDYRGWVAMAPEAPEPQFAVARTLLELGGYAEALAVYQAIGRRWPEQSFEVAIRIGALHRQQGNYAQALRQLDDYVSREGPIDGMRFHYHRGWTLLMLGRDAEAIAEIDRGLESQRDYSGAYRVRSCARARLGRIEEALADQERALELLTSRARDNPQLMAEEIALTQNLVATLRQARRAAPRMPFRGDCAAFLSHWVTPRPRSARLAAAAP